jgi:hypothetical protein
MFGWQALPLVGNTAGWIYPALVGFLLIAASGLVLDLVYLRRRDHIQMMPQQRNTWLLLATLTFLSILAYFYYNTAFVQFQGRYMFTLLIPLGLWLTLGLDAWRRLMLNRWAWSRWIIPFFFFTFALLDVWLLWRVIVPNLLPV